MEYRICSRCEEAKPETSEFFYKHKFSKGGLRAECKICSYNYTLKRKEREPEKFKEQKKKFSAKYKDKVAKYQKCNKDIVRKSHKKWKLKNRDKIRMYGHKRRALARNIETDFSEINWESCKASFDKKCAYCGAKRKLTQDHFIALSKGGEYTINNIIPVCLPCNASKNDKDFFEWYPNQEFYSRIRENKIISYLNYNKEKQQQLALFK